MREHHGNWAAWTFLWDQAVERQADRILGAEFEDAQVDVMLFADALRNVLRGAERVLGRGHQAVQAFKIEVPDAEHVRNIYEHFDAYVEGKGHRQKDGSIGPEDWMPLHSKVGDNFFVVWFGPYRLDVGPAREASARLLVQRSTRPTGTSHLSASLRREPAHNHRTPVSADRGVDRTHHGGVDSIDHQGVSATSLGLGGRSASVTSSSRYQGRAERCSRVRFTTSVRILLWRQSSFRVRWLRRHHLPVRWVCGSTT
jgi:hypothetical protein